MCCRLTRMKPSLFTCRHWYRNFKKYFLLQWHVNTIDKHSIIIYLPIQDSLQHVSDICKRMQLYITLYEWLIILSDIPHSIVLYSAIFILILLRQRCYDMRLWPLIQSFNSIQSNAWNLSWFYLLQLRLFQLSLWHFISIPTILIINMMALSLLR